MCRWHIYSGDCHGYAVQGRLLENARSFARYGGRPGGSAPGPCQPFEKGWTENFKIGINNYQFAGCVTRRVTGSPAAGTMKENA